MLNELHLKTQHFWVTKIALNCVTEVTCVTRIRPDKAISAYNDGKLNLPWPTENLTFTPRMRMLKWRPSPFNYGLDITNIFVVSPQVRYIEVFDITNPRFDEQIWPVPCDFVKSRFYCTSTIMPASSFPSTELLTSLNLSTLVLTSQSSHHKWFHLIYRILCSFRESSSPRTWQNSAPLWRTTKLSSSKS